jgi:hypothetical protein
MKKKKRYVGEGLKWFVDFLPKEIFYSFNEEEHKNYQGYRNYQSKIGMSSVKISNYQKEIEKLSNLIKKEQFKIKGDTENSGWEMKMKIHYDKITHIDKNLQLNCSIERRDRTSLSKRYIDGEIKTFKTVPILKKQYGEKDIERVYKLYGRVENTQNRKQIYFGDEKEVRKEMSDIYGEDWTSDPYEFLKDELRTLVSQYSRYKIFHQKWEGFLKEKHNMKSVKDWCNWCVENGVDRYEWGGKK